MAGVLLAGPRPAGAQEPELPLVVVRKDGARIDVSCRIRFAGEFIADAGEDGVLHIIGEGVTVDFGGSELRGAPAETAPDALRGCGIRVTAPGVTIRGARVSGFKTGIWASGADGLLIEDCDVSGNYRQRLRSTPAAEASEDWLWPHENDQDQWRVRYGAGIYVAESTGVTVRRNRARRGQNGLCLRRVRESRIYDNDFSFLSGWGIALFRCSHNVIARNSCDFCIRGYSHGVYSRGQDSAGILCFEQCTDNLFALNSATHSGDGFFGYAGHAALAGEGGERVGNLRNRLVRNDFSYPAAIGIEMTFSFDNQFLENRLVGGNYGVWGGYSQDTRVVGNTIAENGIAGIAVEHGWGWLVAGNAFRANRRGVELWWDDDRELLAKPWAQRNGGRSGGHRILENAFAGDRVGVELRGDTSQVLLAGNRWQQVAERSAGDAAERLLAEGERAWTRPTPEAWLQDLPGERQAVGARPQLAGREHIVMRSWGPYDWEEPHLQRLPDAPDGAHCYRLLGRAAFTSAAVEGAARVAVQAEGRFPRLRVTPERAGGVVSYRLGVETSAGSLAARGVLVSADWKLCCFAYRSDPREDVEAWRRESAQGVRVSLGQLRLPFAHGGPSQLARIPAAVAQAQLPADRFGTIAETTLQFPAGRWRVRTRSDDGVRVWVDGERVIDNWTHHGPTVDTAEFTRAEPGPASIRVEHFELDGYAVLEVDLEPLEP